MKTDGLDTGSRMDLMFLKLCGEKPMNKIRIAQITELAGCNRRTFYNYYKDLDDMKEKIISRFLAELNDVLKADQKDADEDFLNFMMSRKELMRAFAGLNFDPDFVKELIRTYLRNKGVSDPVCLDSSLYPHMYNVFGILMCVNFWIEQDEKGNEQFSRDELKKMILSLQKEVS